MTHIGEVRIEEVRAISWRTSAELRFLSAEGRSIDAREVSEWEPSPNVREVDQVDGLRREVFRVTLGALAEVDPSIVDGTSPYRSLVAEFDRAAAAFGMQFGREADGSPADEWSLDIRDVQRYAMERHLVMRYACTRDRSSAQRLSRLDAMAGRGYHLDQMEDLVSDDGLLGQQVTSYRARERVARDGWVVERLEGAIADPVAVIESERLARAYVEVLNVCAQKAPSGVVGARTEGLMLAAAKTRLSVAVRMRGGARDGLFATPSGRAVGQTADLTPSPAAAARGRGRG